MSTVLIEALLELKQARLSGDNVTIEEIANEYKLNPALLERKFNESWPNGVSALPKMEDAISARIKKNVEDACKRYSVSVDTTQEHVIRGQKYTVICYLTNVRVRPLIAVSHKDGIVYRVAR